MDREQLLGRRERRYREVMIGNGSVWLRSMTELERSRFEAKCLGKNGKATSQALRDMRALLLCRTVVDAPDGELIFTDDDVEAIQEMDSKVTSAIFDAAMEHIGMVNSDLEELEKNSGAILID